MNGLWKRYMIVKVLGRKVAMAVLRKRLRELWKPTEAMYVMDLPRNFFMVHFESEEEYLAALTGGPWRDFGSYLMVKAWSPAFDPSRDEITTTPVWVRLSNLPVNYYHRTILMGIAKGLGVPIKVDQTTLNFERARFARICVEVDLRKPLKGTVVINGERYFVSYEGLSNICGRCGVYGHIVSSCPQGRKEKVAVENPTPRSEKSQGEGSQDETRERGAISSQLEDGFTMVGASGRRSEKSVPGIVFSAGSAGNSLGNKNQSQSRQVDSQNIAISNSFGSLGKNISLEEITGEQIMVEGDLENQDPNTQVDHGKSGGQAKGSRLQVEKSKIQKKDVRTKKLTGLGHKPEGFGPRPRRGSQLKPTWGLVFRPIGADVELSPNGKRLRVEKEGFGRLGGAVAKSGDGALVSPALGGQEPEESGMLQSMGQGLRDDTVGESPTSMRVLDRRR
ncbi:unnamed protein product [Microthlaspi erraticum]|uniref:CCHC-type domain-containing protein n=1 Tax=Microthlaspi erraticum TaxID=1685480 RepID=A0A6D2HUS8_9BRAS|nr:unnamed protein product [Microthlaspi erraticum]